MFTSSENTERIFTSLLFILILLLLLLIFNNDDVDDNGDNNDAPLALVPITAPAIECCTIWNGA